MTKTGTDRLGVQLGRALAHLELLLEAIEANDPQLLHARAAATRQFVDRLLEEKSAADRRG